MLPEGWTQARFGEVTRLASGQVDPKIEPYKSMRHIGPEDIESNSGRIVGGTQTCADLSLISGKYEFDERAVVYSKIRPHLNKVCRPGFRGVCSADAYPIWPNEKRLTAGYLVQVMLSAAFVKEAVACSARTGMPKINREDLERIQLSLPPLSEQERIVGVMQVWDSAITITEHQLANSLKQKQALLGRLLVHHRQANVKQRDWSFVDFDEVFERVTRKNTEGSANVLTISGAQGLVNQRDYFNKSVASGNLEGYTLLRQGEFAYNKSYSANYPMGAIKPLTRYASGVVSSLYLCFRFREGVAADTDFFRHYFDAGMLNDGLAGIAQEGARNHGLLNVAVGDFFKLRLHIPGVDTQRRIAAALNMTEREQKLIKTQIARLRAEKSALMQQLLTGKRRVRPPATIEDAA